MPQGLCDLEQIRKAAQLAEKTLAASPTANVAAEFSDIVAAQIAGLAEMIALLDTWTKEQQLSPRNQSTDRPRYHYDHQYQINLLLLPLFAIQTRDVSPAEKVGKILLKIAKQKI